MTQFCKIRDRFFSEDRPLERFNGQCFRIVGLDVEGIGDNHSDWQFQVRFADGSVHDRIKAECLFSDFDIELDRLVAVF